MNTLSDTVTTRYVGATDSRGSHYVVRFRGHTHRVPFDYAASNAAQAAAQSVVARYVNNGHALYAGATATGNRYFVNVLDGDR